MNIPISANATVGAISRTAINTSGDTEVYGYASEVFDRPESSVLFLFLMLATLWVGMTLIKFDES